MPLNLELSVQKSSAVARLRGAAPGREFWQAQLRQGVISAWFQPKWELSSGRIVGAEALARWVHPGGGVLSAAAFLAAIRRHGLEHDMLLRMVDAAVVAQSAWQREGHLVPVSVNLPAPLLDVPDLADQLHARVKMQGASAEGISFELLEDDAASTIDSYTRGASRLREKGFGLALDDFGRAYGSLYHLISAPFTEIKIDRAFVDGAVNDDRKRAAVASSVQLGKQLGLTVTAEGVETIEDLDVLLGMGCDCAQGYLCAPALPAGDFANFLGGKGRRTFRSFH